MEINKVRRYYWGKSSFCFREIKESVDSVVWKKEHRLGHSGRHRGTPCLSASHLLWVCGLGR